MLPEPTALKELTPILAAITGGTLAFLGGAIQQHLTRSSERRKLMREKVEEIYALSNQLDAWGQTLSREMVGTVYVQGSRENKEGPTNPMPRLLMLTKIYAPPLGPAATELNEKADACQHSAFEYYLRVAETQKAPSEDELSASLSPFDDVQQGAARFRELLEKHVQQYL